MENTGKVDRILFPKRLQYRGCNFFATKIIIKTAVNKKHCYCTTTKLWLLVLIALVLIQSMTMHKTSTDALPLSKRKHPRSLNQNSLEWENPCNAHFVRRDASVGSNSTRRLRKLAFKPLRKSLIMEYERQFRDDNGQININDFDAWSKLKPQYRFLAEIAPKSGQINLIRWHQNMQIYVASFSYLHKKQQQIDKKFQNSNNNLSKELQKLLNSSKRVLCEIETAVNDSTNRPLVIISKDKMNQIISTFKTKNYQGSHEIEVNQIDLKFVKARYCSYLCEAGRSLRRWIRDHKPLSQRSGNSRQNNNNNNSNNSSVNSSISSENVSKNSNNIRRNPCKCRRRRRV